MTDATTVLDRAAALLDRLEALLPPPPPSPEWTARAFRWRRFGARGGLEPILHPHRIALDDLLGIDIQRAALERNTRQFLAGQGANNALLWGARGTGKSSLVKALLTAYAERGLRLIEITKDDLIDLPDIVARVRARPERFVLFCDDLSFAADAAGYPALKAALDGSLSAASDNVLLYATSNRRHLLAEFHHENRAARVIEGEIHPGETTEEKISLSDRFGLWLSFRPFDQACYLNVVRHWLQRFGVASDALAEQAALQWALARGTRSGRTAWQFARDWAGRQHAAD